MEFIRTFADGTGKHRGQAGFGTEAFQRHDFSARRQPRNAFAVVLGGNDSGDKGAVAVFVAGIGVIVQIIIAGKELSVL